MWPKRHKGQKDATRPLTMARRSQPKTTIESVERTFEVIHELEDGSGKTLTEISDSLDIPKSSIHRHLSTLQELGAVALEDGQYYLGLEFLRLGTLARYRHDAQGTIKDGIRFIAQETDERAQYMVWEHDAVIYLYRELGNRAVSTDTKTGKWMPVHATSGGKLLLAYLPSEEREQYFASQELERYTENTITDLDELREQLQIVRHQRYCINDQEYIDGLRAISVPVRNTTNEVIGAIGVSGPRNRLRDTRLREELPNLLMGVANEIELKFEYQAQNG